MKNLKFVVYREDKHYVAQCLNVDVSSFGETIDEAIRNLKEAVELYFEGGEAEYHPVGETLLGECVVNGLNSIRRRSSSTSCSSTASFSCLRRAATRNSAKRGELLSSLIRKRKFPLARLPRF